MDDVSFCCCASVEAFFRDLEFLSDFFDEEAFAKINELRVESTVRGLKSEIFGSYDRVPVVDPMSAEGFGYPETGLSARQKGLKNNVMVKHSKNKTIPRHDLIFISAPLEI